MSRLKLAALEAGVGGGEGDDRRFFLGKADVDWGSSIYYDENMENDWFAVCGHEASVP